MPKEGKSISAVIKTANKELGQTKRNIDIAWSRGFNMEDILCYDNTREFTLFQMEGIITKPTKLQKNELEKEIEMR